MNTLSLPEHLDSNENRKLRKEYTKLLSEKLREIRKSKKLTQQELANKAGLHLTYVGHLEQGTYHPTMFVMWKISKALGVSINEIANF